MNNEPAPIQPPAHPLPSKSRKRLVWGLVCLLGPTALIILSIASYALFNFLFGASSTDGQMLNESLLRPILNVVLFFVGGAAILAWLPGIIVGIILLAARSK